MVGGGGLELPETFGVGMAVADVLEAEEGEVYEDNQKAKDTVANTSRGVRNRPVSIRSGALRPLEASGDLGIGAGWCAGKRHYIFNGLDWL